MSKMTIKYHFAAKETTKYDAYVYANKYVCICVYAHLTLVRVRVCVCECV